MTPIGVLATLAGLVVLSTVLGLVWRGTTGRARRVDGDVVAIEGVTFGPSATLLQFSTEVCAPCRATARVLGDLVTDTVHHVDVDVTHRPDLAHRFNLLQTPTTLILDGAGVIRARIGGAARRDVVVAELERVLAA